MNKDFQRAIKSAIFDSTHGKSPHGSTMSGIFFFFKRFYLFIFRERGREKEREGEKYLCERETWIGCLTYAPQPGTKPTNPACALTRNQTSDLSLCGTMPNQLSHTLSGHVRFFCFYFSTLILNLFTHLHQPLCPCLVG